MRKELKSTVKQVETYISMLMRKIDELIGSQNYPHQAPNVAVLMEEIAACNRLLPSHQRGDSYDGTLTVVARGLISREMQEMINRN